MKINSPLLLIFLLSLFIFSSYSARSARILLPKRGEQEVDDAFTTPLADLSNLMGLEKCNDQKDEEECLKGRMIAEAHLDYIYTQHHKP